ncbi:reverse transcriptase domain-containing protein [Tanacetum coccineum]|uniref:Reverse transcriptase domain-containing protein n=1 Tax=Tanacetum coccineum TaxID=301880 RepID=A0ABQ4XIZ2_9ASTR
MRTRDSNFPNNSPVTILRRRNRGRAPNVVEPELHTIIEVVPMAERTMEELLRAPTKGYREAIILPEINADHFEIKTNLLQLVQASPFHGFERENPHAHINSFKRITSTLQFRDVPNDVIKLMMFPYSLEGAAKVWYEKEPPNSILTWEDLLTKFVNQFFPPSKTTHLKNEISYFTQKFEETFSEAWERFKEMLRACPHHGFTELTQVDTFYNGLKRDAFRFPLNLPRAGGNLLSKTTKEALNIIENKSKVRYSRNKSNVSRMNTISRENVSKTDEKIDKLADQISTLVDIVSKKVVTPAPVKVVEEICVTCNRPHAWYNCHNTDNNQSSVCAATGTYNQVNPPNRNSVMNTEKLFELAKIPLNENCSTMLLKKLPEKLGDPGKFLIPCNFSGMDLSLPELTPTRMTLELADQSITHLKGLAEDVFVKVGKFHFPTNFVVVDFEADPRVPLILGRSFLRTGRALIDVYGEEITLRVDNEAVTFNLNQTTRYSSTYDDSSINRIDVIDVACEEFPQELLIFSNNSSGGNPTSFSDPILSFTTPSFTPFEGGDFILEEIETFLQTPNEFMELNDDFYDTEGDILYLD